MWSQARRRSRSLLYWHSLYVRVWRCGSFMLRNMVRLPMRTSIGTLSCMTNWNEYFAHVFTSRGGAPTVGTPPFYFCTILNERQLIYE